MQAARDAEAATTTEAPVASVTGGKGGMQAAHVVHGAEAATTEAAVASVAEGGLGAALAAAATPAAVDPPARAYRSPPRLLVPPPSWEVPQQAGSTAIDTVEEQGEQEVPVKREAPEEAMAPPPKAPRLEQLEGFSEDQRNFLQVVMGRPDLLELLETVVLGKPQGAPAQQPPPSTPAGSAAPSSPPTELPPGYGLAAAAALPQEPLAVASVTSMQDGSMVDSRPMPAKDPFGPAASVVAPAASVVDEGLAMVPAGRCGFGHSRRGIDGTPWGGFCHPDRS